jgi:hypothetical protein
MIRPSYDTAQVNPSPDIVALSSSVCSQLSSDCVLCSFSLFCVFAYTSVRLSFLSLC